MNLTRLKVCSIPPQTGLTGTSRQITSTYPNPKSVMVNVDLVDYTPDVMKPPPQTKWISPFGGPHGDHLLLLLLLLLSQWIHAVDTCSVNGLTSVRGIAIPNWCSYKDGGGYYQWRSWGATGCPCKDWGAGLLPYPAQPFPFNCILSQGNRSGLALLPHPA